MKFMNTAKDNKLKRKNRGRTSESEMEEILMHHSKGISNTYISRILKIPRSTIGTIIKRMKEGKPFLPQGGDRRSLLTEENKKLLQSWVEKDPTATLKELQQKTMELLGVKCSITTIKRSLKTFDYTIKKITIKIEEINGPSTINDRFICADTFKKITSDLNAKQCIFIDLMNFTIELVNKRDGLFTTGADIKTRHIFILASMNKYGIISFKIYEKVINLQNLQHFLLNMKHELVRNEIYDPIFIVSQVVSQKYDGLTKILENEKIKTFYIPRHSLHILYPIEQCFIKWKKYVQCDRVQNENQLNQSMENGFVIITEQDCTEYYNAMLDYLEKCLNKKIIN
ncbi:hypothetical protein A3Q56_02389 [Intoshia linei]|uniref:Tc1-like transposase DDE domain-containing protein n=1 Tax=Intoshia linei TaxID=1819745 RepID=A0A177B6E6_9BILA|nr:hypothetical protein A3Q56_02389 [Intoshia linei]